MSLEKFVHLTEYNPYHGAGGRFASKGNAKMTVRQGHGGPSAGRSGKAWASALEKRYGGAERAPVARGKRGKVDSGVQSGGTGDYDFTTGAVRSMVAAGGSRRLAQDLVDMYRPSSGGARARRAAKLDHEQAANGFARERAKKMAAGGDRAQAGGGRPRMTKAEARAKGRRALVDMAKDEQRRGAWESRAFYRPNEGAGISRPRADAQRRALSGALGRARAIGSSFDPVKKDLRAISGGLRADIRGGNQDARRAGVGFMAGIVGKGLDQAIGGTRTQATGGDRVKVPQKLDKYTQPMSKADRRGSLEKATYGMNHPERLTPLGVLRGIKKRRAIAMEFRKSPRLNQYAAAIGRGTVSRAAAAHGRAAAHFALARRAPKGSQGRTAKRLSGMFNRELGQLFKAKDG